MSPLKKVNLYSITQLRTTADDNLASALGELGYSQSFGLIDTKLALGYLTVVISGLLFLVDKKFEFKDTYNVTLASVIVYFLLSGVLLYFTSSKKYKNNKYIGYNDSNQKILIATWTEKFDAVYHLKISINGEESTIVTIEFTKFFDSFGYYKRDAFVEIIKGELEKIEKKDN